MEAGFPTNPEMTAIFEADQRMRAAWNETSSEERVEQDGLRLARTKELLDQGLLASSKDYFHAAILFQHGPTAEDHLKAHLLATIALARGGDQSCAWLAAASLDRFLLSIGRPQIMGTQFQIVRPGEAIQRDFDKSLVTDAMRQALGVPVLVRQEQQRLEFERESAPE